MVYSVQTRYLTNFSDSAVTGLSRKQQATIYERAARETEQPVWVRTHPIPGTEQYSYNNESWSLVAYNVDLSEFWARVRRLEKEFK